MNQPTFAARAVYAVDGRRTPFLKAAATNPYTASDLAVAAARPLLAQYDFSPKDLDEVVLGCVMPGPDEANIARIVALRLGCDESVPAFTVQRNCASGMQALDTAARNIALGRCNLVLAGGTEAMSHAPILYGQAMAQWLARWASAKTLMARGKALMKFRLRYMAPIIGLLRGLSDPIVGLSMGQTAENIAYRFGVTREMMDEFAVRSHQRLARAQNDATFASEIEALYGPDGKFFEHDNGVRADSSMEKLAKLRPVFDKHFGKVTAGNSAQITDGAAWILLASEEAIEQYDLPVLGKLVDSQWAGLDPAQMGLGPVHAMTPIMQRNQLSLDDVDYWEINEAFAAQVLACLQAWNDEDYCRNELGLDSVMGEVNQARLNVDGGGVSLGHPVGASGARITLHLLHTLAQNNAKRGIASLCIGGGQGGALLVENVNRNDLGAQKTTTDVSGVDTTVHTESQAHEEPDSLHSNEESGEDHKHD